MVESNVELVAGVDIEGWPSIPEYYAGRSVFVTGGSGFMGKVLIEKLLRSCPDLRTIFLLLRPKKGKDPGERIIQLGADPLFERLRTEQPSALSKLQVVCGDVKELGLGLSEEDRKIVQREVSVVFHSAASVRFDDPVYDAVLINVRGTREVLILAQQMPQLEALVHVSTTYSNWNQMEVKEQIYPAPGNWRTMIRLAEKAECRFALQCLTPKILRTWGNTYTYAKALAEHVVQEFSDVVPAIIIRPSIVLSTSEEPVPGWTDNFNGPMGLFLGGGKGILRTVLADPHNIQDYVPVDIAIRGFIVLAWQKAQSSIKPHTLAVFNASRMTKEVELQDMIDVALSWLPEYPLDNSLWHPNPVPTLNKHVFFIKALLLHMLPALLVDIVMIIKGQKPMLVKLQRKVYIAITVISDFSFRRHLTDNSKFLNASRMVKPCDMEKFNYDKVFTDPVLGIKLSLIGAKKYLLKDKLPLAVSRKHYQRMYWLDRGLKGAFLVVLAWLVLTSELTHSYFSATLSTVTVFITG